MNDDTINSTEVVETHQVHATTAFTADDSAQVTKPTRVPLSDSFDVMSNRDYSDLSLHALLSQPIPFNSGVATAGIPLSLTFFPHSSLLTASPFHLEKVKGYLGIRATIVVRLVVNADKYTQGRIVVAYQPANNGFVPDRQDHRLVTQLNHVELDFNVDSEVVLKIPHRGPFTHFDITNKRYDTGVVRVVETLAHRGNPVPYTIYLSFEDVDLLGPTATSTVSYESGLAVEALPKKPLSEKVKELSTTMMGASSVPIIGSYITPMAWATAIAGNVLSVFGWSKPITTETPSVYVERAVGKYNNTDGTDYAEPLAMTTTTGVKASDQVGLTPMDEMSYAYLLGIRSQMLRFTYTINTVAGTKIFQMPLDPMSMMAVSNYGPVAPSTVNGAFIAHPMAYLANIHTYYRGSIEVSIELSKTIFHSGRLMVVFEPTAPLDGYPLLGIAPRVLSIADAVNCHKDIVDIRSGNNFAFKFPFTSLTPYLRCGEPYGFVHVFVLNNLVRNDVSVSDTVDVGVRVRACEDFEFAGVTDPLYIPSVFVGSEANAATIGDQTLPVTYESGLEVKEDTIVVKPIGSSISPPKTVRMAEYCIGEQLKSIKQIAMRGKVGYTGLFGTNDRPFNLFQVAQFMSTAFTPFPTQQLFDFYSYAGALYAYSHGGVVITFHNRGAAVAGIGVFSDTYAVDLSASHPHGEFQLVGYVKPNQIDRYYVPPYSASLVRWNYPGNYSEVPGSGDTPDLNVGRGYSLVSYSVFGSSSQGNISNNYELSRAAAEDTQFGGFTGVPFMKLRQPYSTKPVNGANPRAAAFKFNNS